MPRSKRTLEEYANQSDPNDSDYSDHAARPPRKSAKPSKAKKTQPAKKRRRNDSESDDIVSDDESLSEAEDSSAPEFEGDEDVPAERNARGQVTRTAAKNRPVYNEDSSMAGATEEEENEDAEEDEPSSYVPPKTRKPTLLKLKLPKQQLQQLADPFPANRRMTRGMRAASEDMYALPTSEHRSGIVGRATHSPEGNASKRLRRGSRTTRSSKLSGVEEEEEDVEMKQGDVEVVDETTMEVKGSQLEVLESDPQDEPEADDQPAEGGDQANGDREEEGFVPESENGDAKNDEADNEGEDEDDEDPVGSRRRSRRTRPQQADNDGDEEAPQVRRSGRKMPPKSSQRKGDEESDFEPEEGDSHDEDEMSGSEAPAGPSRKESQALEEEEHSVGTRRASLRRRPPRSNAQSDTGGGDIAEELAEELEELKPGRTRRRLQPEIVYEKPRRSRKDVDYRIIRPDLVLPLEDAENEITESPSRRGRGGGGWQRTLFPTYGPFGGGGPSAILGPPGAHAATGGVDSDSSDDEVMQHPKGAGPVISPVMGHFAAAQTHGADQGLSGTPANLGKVKDKQTLADADPLGVDLNVNFDSVGGLQGHIDQLKEMVSLPLLYPEIFQRFHIVPPRGVLFHGPPGTGKTLLARALANSVSSEGRKVTFYMRKGADALSKWVGEAERQLRLLFDEARKTQPSIIFFDEIDGKPTGTLVMIIC